MDSQSEIQVLESIIVEHAGPMGKFVVKKSLQDLGLDNSTLNEGTRTKLVDLVLERAIYDRDRWNPIRNEIFSAWSD